MQNTSVLTDTTDGSKTLTLASIDGTKITAQANGNGSTARTILADDLDRGVQNVNNVGLTVSASLAMQGIVKDPTTLATNVTVSSHATDSTLVILTIGGDARTLTAHEVRSAITNCKNIS